MDGALAGIRVLDLSRVLAGPWASQLLADYGADVIKVERPGEGDDTRHWGPPWLRDRDGGETAESAYYLSANRNKRSVTVNLDSEDGRRIVQDLAAQSDVLIENFRVGALARRGLDAATLTAANPKLVYCSISAYGQQGPRRDEPGYDAMIQGAAGLMSLTGEAAGSPQKTGVAVADLMAGMYAASAVLAALFARETTGKGQVIDVPLFDTQVAWLANQAMNYLVSGAVPQRQGNAHPNIVPYQSFATRDGHLVLAVGNDRQFAACVDCLGLPELTADRRFATNAERVRHRDRLVPLLAAQFAGRTTAEWLERLGERDVPCGPVNDLAQVFADPQVGARGLLMRIAHPLAGEVPAVAHPVRFSATPARVARAAPLLGEHTEEVLRELLGYDAERLAMLRANGAV